MGERFLLSYISFLAKEINPPGLAPSLFPRASEGQETAADALGIHLFPCRFAKARPLLDPLRSTSFHPLLKGPRLPPTHLGPNINHVLTRNFCKYIYGYVLTHFLNDFRYLSIAPVLK